MFVEKGADVGLGDFIPIYEPMPSLDAELQESIDSKDGCVIKADTIEGLAEGMGVDPAVLKATVDRYNEMVAAGKDSDFFKPEKFLHPVAKAPFYAIKERPSILVSDGGIRVNGDMQVTDKKYNPIDNLYAVGNEASGLPANFRKKTGAQAVYIPQSANVDSLNLSSAVSIALYTLSN